MTSLKSAKLQLQSESEESFKKDQNETLVEESDDQSLGESSEEENQRIVDILFPDKKLRRPRQDRDIQCEEDNDIRAFLEEQVPGLYNKETREEIYQEDSEGEESQEELQANREEYLMDYSTVSGPAYFTMSRFQKVSYFEHLNAIYMARMRPERRAKNAGQHFNNNPNPQKKQQANQQGKQNDRQQEKTIKKKRGIKFNQIVCEVPFNKEDEPVVIRETPEEEAFIMFDDEAYDELIQEMEEDGEENEGEERISSFYPTVKSKEQMHRTRAHINEQQDSSSSDQAQRLYQQDRAQFLKQFKQIQPPNDNQLDSSDQEKIMLNDSDSEEDELEYGYGYEEEDSWEWKSVEYQNFVELCRREEEERKQINKTGKQDDEQRKNWKRDSSGQFVEDAQQQSSDDSQDDSQNSESSLSESQNLEKENVQQLQNKPLQQSTSPKESNQKPQFIQGINGRKINPNHVKQQQQQQQHQQTPHQISQDNKTQDTPPQNETSSPIVTESVQIVACQTKPEEQICQNTSEGKVVVE